MLCRICYPEAEVVSNILGDYILLKWSKTFILTPSGQCGDSEIMRIPESLVEDVRILFLSGRVLSGLPAKQLSDFAALNANCYNFSKFLSSWEYHYGESLNAEDMVLKLIEMCYANNKSIVLFEPE